MLSLTAQDLRRPFGGPPNEDFVLRSFDWDGRSQFMVPQGMAYREGKVYLAEYPYFKCGQSCCNITVYDTDDGNKLIRTLALPKDIEHAGGLDFGENGILYVSDTKSVWKMDLAKAEQDGNFDNAILGRVRLEGDDLAGSSLAYNDKQIFIAKYGREGDSHDGFFFDEKTLFDGRESINAGDALRKIPLPPEVQGCDFNDSDGSLVLSRSNLFDGEIVRISTEDGGILGRSEAPAGIEDISIDPAGHIWSSSESGAIPYSLFSFGEEHSRKVFQIDSSAIALNESDKFHDISDSANNILGLEIGDRIDKILAEIINTPNKSPYCKEIDAVYNETRIGGSSLHHLLDGRHDIIGAYKASRDALPDDSVLDEMIGAGRHLSKDLFSKAGLPMASMSKGNYDQLSSWLNSNLGVSKRWVSDMMQVNGLELFGGALSAAAIYFGLKHSDVEQLHEIAGSIGFAGIAAGNPISIACAAISLVIAWRLKKPGQSLSPSIKAFCRGVASTGAAFAVGTALSTFAATGIIPALICGALAVVTGVMVRRFLKGDSAESQETELSLETIKEACLKDAPQKELFDVDGVLENCFDKDFAREYREMKKSEARLFADSSEERSCDEIVEDIMGSEFAAEYRNIFGEDSKPCKIFA